MAQRKCELSTGQENPCPVSVEGLKASDPWGTSCSGLMPYRSWADGPNSRVRRHTNGFLAHFQASLWVSSHLHLPGVAARSVAVCDAAQGISSSLWGLSAGLTFFDLLKLSFCSMSEMLGWLLSADRSQVMRPWNFNALELRADRPSFS